MGKLKPCPFCGSTKIVMHQECITHDIEEKFMNNQLTMQDLDLLIKGLDALPHSGEAGEMMGELFVKLTSNSIDNPEKIKKIEMEMAKKKNEREKQKLVIIEDTIILKTKLILMKRELKDI